MADDRTELIGKWTVKFQKWTWEYTFSGDGSVTWRDPLNELKGSGRWTMTGQLVNLSWAGSTTKESWNRQIRPADQRGWVTASYGSGPLKAQKVPAAAPAPNGSGLTPVNPAVANVPWDPGYVDMYSECKYDVNYKIPPDASFAFSSILQLRYSDGVSIELDIDKDFSPLNQTPDAARDSMARGNLGRGGRIFPTALTFRTTPRLWAARAEAFRIQNQAVKDFADLAMAGVSFVLSVPAMPAGALEEAAVTSAKVSRRSVAGTKVPPAPIENNMVKLGTPGTPGNLFARIQSTPQGVVYVVDMIVLEGETAAVATARATHREMIKRAAQTAQAAGQRQFKMVGKQANENFARHADRLAQEIGVPGSGKRSGMDIPGFSDYEVILDVMKALGLP